MQPDRDGALAFDVLHSRGIRSFLLHGRCEPATLRAFVVGRRLLDDRVLPALQQPSAGILHLAHARVPSRLRARGNLRTSSLVLRTLSAPGSPVSLAPGARLSRGGGRAPLRALAAPGDL